ncbi:protoporphyrinogen oxidase HemJ [Magnetospira sp. QH-2]|uniref:protoporphyrinogen oxidase HemJ n=1 Tax=Magnetospira sp. (strain QH-2) TaxID=1288970 RepID=UPI0003E81832|nr:protoporphyrinogen oxidase HemJ [Magnetospira sp. QH-2]CCQ75619.1 conserved hypothetical protein of unknown function [Magnetospira sp. QH-2]
MLWDLSGEAWMWTKALHIICVMAWMAGHFYLPRLYVYHAQEPADSATGETFKIMERRLLKAIMNPAAVGSLVFGLILLGNLYEDAWLSIWLWVKLVCVVGLFVMHFLNMKWRMEFLEDRNQRSHKFYRYANEVPTVLMIVLIIMVVVKPWE